ncbi:hypothetical protein F5141DRAFT_1070771 [Pisolithus sp. B1]|nr:hypothetical protein F5141DRAFT_1070771 [Pisolithus sp. B1]
MQLTAMFILLAFATYGRAGKCLTCPETAAGQALTYAAYATVGTMGPETMKPRAIITPTAIRAHTALIGCVHDCGPHPNYGQFAGYCDYTAGDSDCPNYIGGTLGNCDICPWN